MVSRHSGCRYRSLDAVDVELEEAVEGLRQYVSRCATGRVHLVVERLDRVTIAHALEADRLTTADIERVMKEPPRRVREGR